jgi:ADP-ribose pyrophosphatase YjhB (NUDIX family)
MKIKIDDSWYKKPAVNLPERLVAGGVVVRKEDGKLLVGLIRDKKYEDYMLPKGGVEKGESLEEAAKREVFEETGINKLNLIFFLGKKERLSSKKHVWAITSYYLFTTDQVNGTQNLQEGEEDLVFGWLDINKLPSFFWPEQKDVIEENLEKIKKAI